MVISSRHKFIIDELYALYKSRGFIREDEALDLLSAHDSKLTEIDFILDKLLSMGVIFAEDDTENDDSIIDKAHVDYDVIYDEIVRASPGEKILVDYIRNIRPPQNREWRTLIPQAKNGNKYALNRLFEMYIRVVVRIALNYYKDGKIDLDDAIQEGAIGLMRALRCFDPTKHENPASYVGYWIMQHINRALADTGRTIRIPVHMFETIKKFERDSMLLAEEYGREPADEELASCLELTIEEVVAYKLYGQEPLSLDEIMNQKSEETLKDLVIDYDSLSPFEAAEKSILREAINQVVETLIPRERDIIYLRMGFFDGKERTLEEVGGLFGVTRERIRQIEAKALRKLRHPTRSRKFCDSIEINVKTQSDDLKEKKESKKASDQYHSLEREGVNLSKQNFSNINNLNELILMVKRMGYDIIDNRVKGRGLWILGSESKLFDLKNEINSNCRFKFIYAYDKKTLNGRPGLYNGSNK